MADPQPAVPGAGDAGQDPPQEGGAMGFLEHLEELRSRVLWSMLALIAAFMCCFPVAPTIFRFLSRPLTRALPPGETLAYTRLTEPFFVNMKVAALAGIFLASPFLMLQLWLFVSPALYRKEKRYAIPFVVASTSCFLLGAAFAFELLFPVVCDFFLTVGEDYKMMVTLDQYFSLLFWTVLGVALTFELPVVTGLLARLGVVSAGFLWKNFHIAVVACMVLAALITPTPDALTMMFVAVPMILLYAISIVVAKVLGRPPEDGGDAA